MTDLFTLPSPSPEWELLRRCSRPAPDADARARIVACLDQPLSWPRVLALADAHGVSGVLHLALTAAAPHAVPPSTGDVLARRFYEATSRGLRLSGQLTDVVGALSAAGIRAVALKGPALATQAYGRLGSREFNDLDVLVGREQIADARAALERAGYAALPAHRRMLDGPFPRAEYHCGFVSRAAGDGRVMVEVHAEPFMWYFAIDWPATELRSRAVEIDLCGRPVDVLSPTDDVLFLAVHAATHSWSRLEHVTSFLAMAERGDVDWPALWRRAAALDAERMLRVGVALAELLAGGANEVLAPQVRQCDPASVRVARLVAQRLMRPRPGPLWALERIGIHLAVRDGWGGRARYAWRSLATPAAAVLSYQRR